MWSMGAKHEDFIGLMLEETYAHSHEQEHEQGPAQEATVLDFAQAWAQKSQRHPLKIHYHAEIGCFRIYPAEDFYLDCPRTWAGFQSLVDARSQKTPFVWEIRPQNDEQQLLKIFTFLQEKPVVGIDVGWGEDRQLYWVLLIEETSKNSSSTKHLSQGSDYCR